MTVLPFGTRRIDWDAEAPLVDSSWFVDMVGPGPSFRAPVGQSERGRLVSMVGFLDFFQRMGVEVKGSGRGRGKGKGKGKGPVSGRTAMQDATGSPER